MQDYNAIQQKVFDDLAYELELQKNRFLTVYQGRTEQIDPNSAQSINIDISGSGAFKCLRMFGLIDKIFFDDFATITILMTDVGSGNRIIREPTDFRLLANPGIFDPASANVGVAQMTTGIPWPHTFPAVSTIKLDFASSETTADKVHKCSIGLMGVHVRTWDLKS